MLQKPILAPNAHITQGLLDINKNIYVRQPSERRANTNLQRNVSHYQSDSVLSKIKNLQSQIVESDETFKPLK